MSVPASALTLPRVTRFRVSVTVEANLALLHISVFLFLAGLIVSLETTLAVVNTVNRVMDFLEK